MLVVMGSGETAPTMVKVHRRVFALAAETGPRTGAPTGPGLAVMVDTPFGFQMNADDLVTRTKAYFAQTVGVSVEVAGWRSADAPVVEQERALALLTRASWAFAGPGSPTYVLRQWSGTPMPDALLDVVTRGGTLVFGSAAACTLGTHTVPVYEIYKVGAEPHWAQGLDLLGRLTGIHAVLIPHFDNAEGGNHDTRFCYLGEQRLAAMEAQLPEEIGVLGIDEHTALLVDLTAGRVMVEGNGVVTVRRRGSSRTFPAGSSLSLETLAALLRGEQSSVDGAAPDERSGTTGQAPRQDPAPPEGSSALPGSLREEAETALARFDTALASRDADDCVGAVLDLESAIVAWSSDTLQSDDTDQARRALRSMIVRLGELAHRGLRDPREIVGPFVDALIEVRGAARSARDYATSDLIRDRLVSAGIEVRDSPDGVQWSVATTSGP